jgi:hypothetical protein
MKFLGFILLLTSVAACDPYGFGFKKNPAYVLNEAFKAIMNQDQDSFVEVTGKEAVCIYGNEKGLTYLKDQIHVSTENIKLNPKLIEKKHYPVAVWVGYWSYYHERYMVEIQDKESKNVIAQTVVDCEYGTATEKDDRLLNKEPTAYKTKECRTIKLMPKTFSPLPLPQKCGILKIDL